MNLTRQIKKLSKEYLSCENWKLHKIQKGYFMVDGKEIVTPVLIYLKENSVRREDGKAFNCFGLIYSWKGF